MVTNEIDTTAALSANNECHLLLSGLDTLYVGFNIDPVGGALDFDELAFQQALRQEDRALEYETLTLGSMEFLLRPYGRNPYKYILANEDFEIALTERMLPNFYVRFLSKALWLKGAEALEAILRDWFASLKLKCVREESVSRADWAFDYHLVDPCLLADHFVSRADKDSTWRNDGKVETLTFGKGDTVVRVYDKIAEIEQQSDKSWFYQIWGRNSDVWRIEVQVRRERLKSGGIKTLRDLDDLSADLLREILGGHTTMRTPSDDSNRSRWPLSPLWQDLLRVIEERPQTGLVASYDPATELDYRLAVVTRSVYGYLKQVGALHGIRTRKGAAVTFDQLLEALAGYVKPFHSPEDWALELERRIKAVGAGK